MELPTVTTSRRGKRGRRGRGTSARSRAAESPAEPAAPPAAESVLDTFLEQPEPEPEPEPPAEVLIDAEPALPTSAPEPRFAAMVPPPAPVRPLPATRRVIFFDVENTSRAEHIQRVLTHLGLDWSTRATELVAVGNWRVIGHDTARLLARHGAELVHSAPSVGVRDWSDLRIAVAAGVWLAGARPGDGMEIVTDDQAFDAVGDVAASLGVGFRRLSYRALLGMAEEAPEERPSEGRSRRRRRGGRRGGRRDLPRELPRETRRETPALRPGSAEGNGAMEPPEGHTAPHDEIIAVVRDLLAASSDGGVTIDALSNALKSRGFRRPPGSPRLITRLRRIKEIEVSRTGMIRLASASEEPAAMAVDSEASETAPVATEEGAPPAAPRRRRRRGGRRRRGRGGSHTAAGAP